jgi:leucyl aminopeptidase
VRARAGQRASAETIRQAAGALARAARKHRLDDVVVALPVLGDEAGDDGADLDAAAAAEAVVTGLLLAGFDFDEFKGSANGRDETQPPRGRSFTLLCPPESAAGVRAAIDRGRVIAEGQNFARTIASRPGNVINPPSLARVAQDLAKEVGLTCRVLDEKQMQRLGMGGILAVGAGSSATPPRMIVLEYAGVGGGGSEVGKKSPSVRPPTPDPRHPTPDPPSSSSARRSRSTPAGSRSSRPRRCSGWCSTSAAGWPCSG